MVIQIVFSPLIANKETKPNQTNRITEISCSLVFIVKRTAIKIKHKNRGNRTNRSKGEDSKKSIRFMKKR